MWTDKSNSVLHMPLDIHYLATLPYLDKSGQKKVAKQEFYFEGNYTDIDGLVWIYVQDTNDAQMEGFNSFSPKDIRKEIYKSFRRELGKVNLKPLKIKVISSTLPDLSDDTLVKYSSKVDKKGRISLL